MTPTENKKKTAKDVLFEYVQSKNSSFYWYHNPDRINQYRSNKIYSKTGKKIKKDVVIHKCLYDFFEATLDEVRLKKANDFSTSALNISDNGLLAYFREAASKREFAADIDYNMQRDHAAHTLYNYILGWYFFDHSKAISEAFKVHLVGKKEKLLHIKPLLKDPNDLTPLLKDPNDNTINDGDKYGDIDKNTKILANEFGDVWSITSLLHDIGYILEGTISSASIEVENVRVSRGSKLIHDYFNHRFWNRTKIDFRAVQGIAAVLRVSLPDFRRSQSLSSLGDHLCNIGFCENIRDNLKELDGFESLNKPEINAIIKESCGLNRNAFSLWDTYYKVYADTTNEFYIKNGETTKMERILDIVKNEYNDAIWKGSNQGYRNLNHGVCSGLIALKALSFFYDFVYGFNKFDTWEKYSTEYKKLITQGSLNGVDMVSKKSYEETKSFITTEHLPEQIKRRNRDCGRNADFWFDKVLWATASVAIHDVIQEKYYETICKKHNEKTGVLKIGINDDPLAFLGVLVDALQEWDRYTVLGESAFTDTEPLQSTEVDLLFKSNNEPIHLNYPKKNGSKVDFSGDIEKVLNGCLENWKGIVTIAEKFLCPHCDEPLAERSYQSSEIVIEHDYKAFECGRVIVDGKVTVECKNIVESSTT